MKYFYTDPLAAAWMAKHFGMKLQCCLLKQDTPIEFINIISNDMLNTLLRVRECGNLYIHPESLHLLEPQEGDIAICPQWNSPADVHLPPVVWWINQTTLNDWKNKRKKSGAKAMDLGRIIQRNGVAFMWPESEK